MERDLIPYLLSVARMPFKWGDHDCLTFANNCVKIQRGKGFACEWVGGYKSAIGAARKYAAQKKAHPTYESIIDVADDRLTPEMTLHPRNGYIVARESNSVGLGCIFGVVLNGESLFVGKKGIERLPHQIDERYWSL